MKKEIPILMSTMMVQAILQGRKTKTRRLRGLDEVNKEPVKVEFIRFQEYPDSSLRAIFQHEDSDEPGSVKCPYGKPGDVLWVRETWWSGYVLDENDCIPDNTLTYWYKADTNDARPGDMSDERCYHLWGNNKECWPKWKPSIHMPKESARVWLEVTDVRVERLQDITEEDAKAEGVKSFRPVPGDGPAETLYYHYTKDKWGPSPKHSFETLWRKINDEESWNKNPWVWVIAFKVLSTTGKPMTEVLQYLEC